MSEHPRLDETTRRPRGPVDPSAVPAHPVVSVEIRPGDGGVHQGLVDGEVVAADRDHERVRRRVMSAAASVAARQGGSVQAVRVRALGADGSVSSLVVTAAGEIIDAEPQTVGPADPRPAPSPGPEPARTPTPTPTPESTPAPEAAPDQAPEAAPEAAPDQAEPAAPGAGFGWGTGWGSGPGSSLRSAAPRDSGPGPARLVAGGLVAALLLVGGIAVAVNQVGDDGGDPGVSAPSPVPLPVVAPEPYDQTAAWSVGLGAPSLTATEDVVVADESRVYVVRDGGRTVAAYDASTGLSDWRLDVGGDVLSGPTLMEVGGETLLAVASAQRLLLLDPASGSASGDFELPADHRGVRMTATGPVVLIEATHVQIVVEGELVTRVIPANGYPVAPDGLGSLVVVGNDGLVWTVDDERRAGTPQELPRVKGHVLETAAGWTPSQLVLTYRARRQTGFGSVRLVAVDTGDWSFQWSTEDLPPLWSGSPGEFGLQTAPGGGWGIYGTEAVALDSGASIRLADDWRTTAVGDALAFGTGSGRPLVATPEGVTPGSANSPRLNSLTHLTAPQAVVGEDRAFLVVNSATDSVLYALRR